MDEVVLVAAAEAAAAASNDDDADAAVIIIVIILQICIEFTLYGWIVEIGFSLKKMPSFLSLT